MCSLFTAGFYERQKHFLNFRQKLPFFLDIHFCMNNIMSVLREDILFVFLEIADHAEQSERLGHQPKEPVDQNFDKY